MLSITAWSSRSTIFYARVLLYDMVVKRSARSRSRQGVSPGKENATMESKWMAVIRER